MVYITMKYNHLHKRSLQLNDISYEMEIWDNPLQVLKSFKLIPTLNKQNSLIPFVNIIWNFKIKATLLKINVKYL